MADYIDRENYCKSICRCSRDKCDKDKCPLWAAPAATVREDVQGEWIVNTDDFTPKKRCSNCGYNKPMEAGEKIRKEPENFCPNCGARMRGEGNV